jgi:hypothetical protein
MDDLVGPSFHPSWPEPARALVAAAIDRHGGWSLWRRLESVSLSLVSLRGLLPSLKGYERSFRLPHRAVIYPKAARTEWFEGGAPAAVFEGGDVRLLDAGAVVLASRDHRRTFAGLRKLRRWRQADGIYFFGYALASYAAVPFALPSLRFVGEVHGRWRGERLRGVRVEWPAGAPVHSRRQAYFFDTSGLLRRNDYVAEIVGRFACGAHGWEDYATVEGLPIPRQRTVLLRLGTRVVGFPAVLSARLDELAVRLGPSQP